MAYFTREGVLNSDPRCCGAVHIWQILSTEGFVVAY